MIKEEALYEPIKKALEEKFNNIGKCFLEITSKKIEDSIKKILDDHSVFILETEDKKPDLMGYVLVPSESGFIDKRLVVVEVKNKELKIADIYQIKMYAEVFNTRYAFLISPQGFSEARRRFLQHRFLLHFGGVQSITIMQLLEDYSLKRDNILSYIDPFATEP
ncbi:hypothetical protein CEE45_01625 [Candidatus Heimdallarchaeota archaeon B3_Heim]|nr:MAG: hypothetical protein CEE45_01625 [Candidatus Heimdallarchaeota archaeon B3_Heim]